MTDERVVECANCAGEGCGRALDPDDGLCACRYCGTSTEDCPHACRYCDGTGGEVIETEPITMEDLDEMAGAAGFEPATNAGVKVLCLKPLGDAPVEK